MKYGWKSIYEEIESNAEALRHYAELLSLANGRARLTGPSDPRILWNEHIADSAYALQFLPKEGSCIDVGTGGGLPGLVWAICRPGLRIVLADSIGRKCALVDEMAKSLSCGNVTVINARSEDIALKERETFDLAAARGVSHSCVTAEYLAPLVRPGGRLLAFKGPKAQEELAVPRSQWARLGLAAPVMNGYTLGEKSLFIVTWEKRSPCSKTFPRRPGAAEKNPWAAAFSG